MATETVSHITKRIETDPAEMVYRKLIQAEALSTAMVGEFGEGILLMNDTLQDNLRFLLSDLITEIRTAAEACSIKAKEARA